jgi:iron complex outermembrane receptor protein
MWTGCQRFCGHSYMLEPSVAEPRPRFAQTHDICIIAHMCSRSASVRRSPCDASRFRLAVISYVLLSTLLLPRPSAAQAASDTTSAEDDGTPRFRMPTVTVTAQKVEEDEQKVPVSVTAVSRDTIQNADVHIVSDAAIFAPNVHFTEWSARKLSNASYRGISSSPNNPGITTFIDGVPQMNANSSSIELLDVNQIEFVRGPQSALFGRNTLGGLVNVTSVRPSTTKWGGSLTVPFGDYGAWAVRGAASGPLAKDWLSLGVAFAEVRRDGFTINDVTGHDIDNRSAFSGKAQLLWKPSSNWEGRVIVTGERARDGDYSLNDVGALRANPFRAARDFEGHSDRDVFGTTVLAARTGGPVVFSSTTGFLRWKTQDVSDLDYTPRPLITRDNTEHDFQFTEEVRLASAENAPIRLGTGARLRWQSGVFLFTQNYDQDAINSYAPFLITPFALSEHSPRSTLDDFGLGVFGQATVTLAERLDFTGGARVDFERKKASLQNFYDPAIAPPSLVTGDKDFSNVSPQASVAYRVQSDKTLYFTVGRGYKAGGFNSVSPAGSEAYGEERTWTVEGGTKTSWVSGRLSANAAVFYINWDGLQLNVPNPAVPAQFYIANVGGAVSKGAELEIGARAAPNVDVFISVGYTHARFGAGSFSSGVDVAGNRLPNTPDYTTSAGIQYSRAVAPGLTALGRADVVFYGAFKYTDSNLIGQDAYSLVNLRAALSGPHWSADIVVRNAFDTRYIPLAFPYASFAPSGFVGEMGAPRTFTVSGGVRF